MYGDGQPIDMYSLFPVLLVLYNGGSEVGDGESLHRHLSTSIYSGSRFGPPWFHDVRVSLGRWALPF